jgi:hypothetical protein
VKNALPCVWEAHFYEYCFYDDLLSYAKVPKANENIFV